jgi:hypothetical protein
MLRILGVLSILSLLVWPTSSFALLTWLDVNSASLDGSASVWQYDENGGYHQDNDSGSSQYPGDPMPIHIDVMAQIPPGGVALCIGAVDAATVDLTLWDTDWGWPYWHGADASIGGALRRAFRLDGGIGQTSVSIPFHLTGNLYGDAPFAMWSAGVSDVSTLQGFHFGGIVDEAHEWVGSLEYGRVYEFALNLSARGGGDPYSGYVDYRAELQAPVPEAASLILFAAGIGAAGLWRGGRSRRNRTTKAAGEAAER